MRQVARKSYPSITAVWSAAMLALTLQLSCLAETPTGIPNPTPKGEQQVVEMQADVHINTHTVWKDAHYRIHGNLFLDQGGTLILENTTVELMNTYSRQFNYHWAGGKLISTNSTLGGTMREGTIYASDFELYDGEWTCTDTTIRYCYGMIFDGTGKRLGKLRATRLIAGPIPDTVIMTGRGDAIVKDSSYMISLFSPVVSGGKGVLDFPVDTPINRVFDGSNIPGAQYRLELINTKVPLWFLFTTVSMEGPPAEFELRHCPRTVIGLTGSNLKGSYRLPVPWEDQPAIKPNTSFQTANLTWKTLEEPAGISCWAIYPYGEETDLTLTGPTRIAEIILRGGKLRLIGDQATRNISAYALTFEVGQFATGTDPKRSDSPPPPAELLLRNVTLGIPKSRELKGQITAWPGGTVRIENSRCVADLLLIAKPGGAITLKDVEKEGEITLRQEGGTIQFLDESPAAAKPSER